MKFTSLILSILFCLVAGLYATPAYAQCANPSGLAGEKIYNENYRVMQYCDDTNWISMGKGASILHGEKTEGEDYAINAVAFDGVTDRLTHSTALSGVSDTKMVTGSFWVKDNNLGDFNRIFEASTSGAGEFLINIGVSDQIRFFGDNASGTVILDMDTSNNTMDGTWKHILFSFDLSDPSRRHIYVDDTSDLSSASIYIDDFLDVTGNSNNGVGSLGALLGAELADMWVDFGTYIDLSIEENRRKFINADGQAIDLGADGSLPTGSAPDLFLSGDTASWHTNKGTGGGLTEVGTITNAASLPPSEQQKKLVGWWRLDETSGTTAVDSSSEGNDGTMTGGLSGTDTTAGPTNTALTFDGTDDTVNIGDIELTNTSITLAAWVNFNNTADQAVFGKYAAAGGQRSYALSTDSSSRFVFRVSSDGSSGNSMNVVSGSYTETNIWRHVVATFDSSTGTSSIYIDGSLINSATNGAINALFDSSAPLVIGNYQSTYTNGAIDDVRIYNFALNATQINELFAASSNFYTPNAVTINRDTETDQVTGAHGIAADSKILTGSFWALRDGSELYISTGSASGGINLILENDFRIQTINSANTTIADIRATGVGIADQWQHILFSIDLSDPTKRHIYIDDVSALNTVVTYTDDFINYTVGGHETLRLPATGSSSIESIADFWLTSDTYIDFSVETNRRKFIDASGAAVYLGANGEIPTGASPDIFLSGDTASWHTNKGTGGGFTENGALTDAATSPPGAKQPRYCTAPVQPEGTLIYNSDENVMQYCDGYTYRPLGPQGNGGAGCSNPTGIAGMMFYNTDFATLMYCEGDEWIGVGRDPTTDLLASGLVGHWTLDETTGTTATDSSGNGNDGALTGTDFNTDSITGTVDTALNFDGSDDRIEVASTPTYSLTSFSYAFWTRLDAPLSGNFETMIARNRLGANWVFIGKLDSQDKIEFRWAPGSSTMSSTADISADTWYHVVATYDFASNEANLYIDGTLDNTASGLTPQPIATDDIMRFGQNTNGNEELNGQLDDVRIYNRALSAGEITALYNLGDCPVIGDVCNDGSIYAGLSPDGNVSMFVTPTDAPGGATYTWNDGNTNYSTTSVTDNDDGDGNTNSLVTIDSDSVTAGTQPHDAAQYCYDLISNGYSDWYLPANTELDEMITNQAAIGLLSGPVGDMGTSYWASTEFDASGAIRRNTSGSGINPKSQTTNVRCVRK